MRPARILVVDDTAEVRILVCRILEGQGYDVIGVSDAEQAIAACKKEKEIDLLLTDIKMPVMDGVELAAQLTASCPQMRVLFISGQCEETEIQANLEKGYGFLAKPFMPHRLIEAVQEALAHQKRPPNTAGKDLNNSEKKHTG